MGRSSHQNYRFEIDLNEDGFIFEMYQLCRMLPIKNK